MLRREYWNIKDFALVKEVGSGAASTVYYALCRKSCLPVAIKMYNKAKLTKLNRRQVEREINIHSSLSHPHIIDFYAAFEDDHRIFLVLEYAAGGDLFDEVKRRGGRMAEGEVVQQVMYPYLCALAYLHSRGIIHRDIKPENTVYTKEHVMKVTDFGLAINSLEERPVTRLGTLDYMAPEVLRCPDKHMPEDNKEAVDLQYCEGVDAWAMGVLAYELIVGRPPFGMSDRESTMRAITSLHPAIPDWLSPAAASFINAALEKASPRRAPISKLIQHPWILMHTRTDMMAPPAPALRELAAASKLPVSLSFNHASPLSLSEPRVPTTCAADAFRGALAGQQADMAGVDADPGPLPDRPACSAMSDVLMYVNCAASSTGGGIPQHGQGQAQGQGQVQGLEQLLMGSSPPDIRPSKRLLQRCMSSYVSEGAPGGASCSSDYTGAKLHDQSYWCTDGVGWGREEAGTHASSPVTAAQKYKGEAPAPLPLQHPARAPSCLDLSCFAAEGPSRMDGVETSAGSETVLSVASDFYRSHIRDLQDAWDGGKLGRGPKVMSRSFSVKRRTPDVFEDAPMQPAAHTMANPAQRLVNSSSGSQPPAFVAPSPSSGTVLAPSGSSVSWGMRSHLSQHGASASTHHPSRLSKMKRSQELNASASGQGQQQQQQTSLALALQELNQAKQQQQLVQQMQQQQQQMQGEPSAFILESRLQQLGQAAYMMGVEEWGAYPSATTSRSPDSQTSTGTSMSMNLGVNLGVNHGHTSSSMAGGTSGMSLQFGSTLGSLAHNQAYYGPFGGSQAGSQQPVRSLVNHLSEQVRSHPISSPFVSPLASPRLTCGSLSRQGSANARDAGGAMMVTETADLAGDNTALLSAAAAHLQHQHQASARLSDYSMAPLQVAALSLASPTPSPLPSPGNRHGSSSGAAVAAPPPWAVFGDTGSRSAPLSFVNLMSASTSSEGMHEAALSLHSRLIPALAAKTCSTGTSSEAGFAPHSSPGMLQAQGQQGYRSAAPAPTLTAPLSMDIPSSDGTVSVSYKPLLQLPASGISSGYSSSDPGITNQLLQAPAALLHLQQGLSGQGGSVGSVRLPSTTQQAGPTGMYVQQAPMRPSSLQRSSSGKSVSINPFTTPTAAPPTTAVAAAAAAAAAVAAAASTAFGRNMSVPNLQFGVPSSPSPLGLRCSYSCYSGGNSGAMIQGITHALEQHPAAQQDGFAHERMSFGFGAAGMGPDVSGMQAGTVAYCMVPEQGHMVGSSSAADVSAFLAIDDEKNLDELMMRL